MYDIKGNLDIKTSLFNSIPTSNPKVILVETIEVDEFEDQDVDTISVVSDMNDIQFVLDHVHIETNDADTIFVFVPDNSTININEIDHVGPNDPTTPKSVLFGSLPPE